MTAVNPMGQGRFTTLEALAIFPAAQKCILPLLGNDHQHLSNQLVGKKAFYPDYFR
jgi:hypothetical protein